MSSGASWIAGFCAVALIVGAVAFGGAPRAAVLAVARVTPWLVALAVMLTTLRPARVPPLARALAPVGAVVCMVLPVFDAWARVRTHSAFVAGILPYSDGRGYYTGALHLLHDGVLDAWDSRRALNPAFLAGRLALAGGDLRGALVLQAAAAGAGAFLAARAVSADVGRGAGLVVYAVVWFFGAAWMATVWTEPLGLTLGALSFAALWHAARAPSFGSIAAGFALTGLAQNARAGALFAVPALLAWVGWRLPSEVISRGRRLLAALAGLALAWAINRGVTVWSGGNPAGGHGAFAYTLYGLAHGGRGWRAALEDHPELASLDDAAAASRIYALAWGELARHPLNLLRGFKAGIDWFVYGWTDGLSGGLLDHHPWAQWCYFFVLAAGVAWLVRRTGQAYGGDPARAMVNAACGGVLLSVPVVFLDGSERVFAATIPHLAALAALAISALRRDPEALAPAPVAAHDAMRWAPLACGVAVLAVATVGPVVGRATCGGWRADVSTGSLACAPGERAMLVASGPESPRVEIVAGAGRTFVPVLDVGDYRAAVRRVPDMGENPSAPRFRSLTAGTTLALGYDLRTRNTSFLAGPRGWLPARRGALAVCARPEGDELLRVTRVGASP